MWIDALQRKADEDTLVLQKLTSDWQNYSQALGAMKSNISSTAQNVRLLQNSLVAGQQRIFMSNEMYYDLTQQVCAQWLQLGCLPDEDTLDFLSGRSEISPLLLLFQERLSVYCLDDEPAGATGQRNDCHG